MANGDLAKLMGVAALLIIAGVVITPLYHPAGSASFWTGISMFAIGTAALFFR